MRPRPTTVRGLLAFVVILILSGVTIEHAGQGARIANAISPVTPSPMDTVGVPPSLGAALMGARYAIYQDRDQAGTWYARNPSHRLRTEFTSRGIQVTTAAADGQVLRVDLSLRSIGYGARQHSVTSGRPVTTADRFELLRQTVSRSPLVVSEWYVNTPAGLEQSFRLERPPDGRVEGEVLRLTLSLDSDLSAHASDDGQAILFRDASAVPVLRYDKLLVTDGRGHRLPARMEISSNELWLDVDDRDAVWPITIDPTFALQQKLLAPDPVQNDQFGYFVAISGDTVVVGAPGGVGLPPTSDPGSAYVFVRIGGVWAHQQTLMASDPAGGDRFGSSVAIDGDTLVVGAIGDDGSAGPDQGSAYVFERIGGIWTEQLPKLVAPNAESNDSLGYGSAIDGDTIIVGALNGGPTDQGSAYVFVRSGGSWILQQELVASDPSPTGQGDFFGASVAVSGQTIVIGAFGDDIGQNAGQGSAYVFVWNGTIWTEEAKLLASDGAAVDHFGHSVAVSGDTVVIGAPRVDLFPPGIDVGAAYVFVRAGGAWNQQQKLFTSDPDVHTEVGYAVAFNGSTIVLSADLDDTNPIFAHGSAYVFNFVNGVWAQTQKLLAPDAASGDQLGFSVAISGETIVVGAAFDDETAVDQGSVYIFVNTPPQIAAAAVSRPQGTNQSGAVVAAVSDAETVASELSIAVNGSTTATTNGVTVGALAVATSGQVTASIKVGCSASTASFTLRVTDTGGLFAEDTLTVTVTPNQPPALVLNAGMVLWPPDRSYHLALVSAMVASATDDCDGNLAGTVVIEKATSDEPDDAPGAGDNTLNDILIAADCRSVQVRAERLGGQNGRVYTIMLRVADSSGHVTNAVFKIAVPHNEGRTAIEDPPAMTVVGCGGG